MRSERVVKSRVKVGAVLACVAALWTLGAGSVLIIGLFAAADSRCNGEPPRVDMDGGWLVIATVFVWAAPFVVVAIRRTSLVSAIIALLTVGLGVAIVVDTFWTPGTFCF